MRLSLLNGGNLQEEEWRVILHKLCFPGADILRFYGLYIIIIAVNGIIECFAVTIMDQEQVIVVLIYVKDF